MRLAHDALEEQIGFLLSAALKKSGNFDAAQDLAQETLLCALRYRARGGKIQNPRAFLLKTLDRRFCDALRAKYRLPVVSMETVPEPESEEPPSLSEREETAELRRQIAFLSRVTREAIVRRYLHGQSVGEIAAALGVPEGTVKSRLSGGREQIRKGWNHMEPYARQSCEPLRLFISCSGRFGLNGEPMTVAEGDLLAQNLLILAYEKPVTEQELSRAIGVPAAYVEPLIEKLVQSELMKREGGRIATDFILYTLADREKRIPAQKELAGEHFSLFWGSLDEGLGRVRTLPFYGRLTPKQRDCLELFYAMECLDRSVYGAFSSLFQAKQDFPDRPNGGKWIAMGFVGPLHPDPQKHRDLDRYCYAGERNSSLGPCLGAKSLAMHVFDTSFAPRRYFERMDFATADEDLIRLLYVLHRKIDPAGTAFNAGLFEHIPWLCECGVVRMEERGAVPDIPLLAPEEFGRFETIAGETSVRLQSDISGILADHLQNHALPVPEHLQSVPEQKRYLLSMDALPMAVVIGAKERGLLLRGGAKSGPRPAMVLVVEE